MHDFPPYSQQPSIWMDLTFTALISMKICTVLHLLYRHLSLINLQLWSRLILHYQLNELGILFHRLMTMYSFQIFFQFFATFFSNIFYHNYHLISRVICWMNINSLEQLLKKIKLKWLVKLFIRIVF